MAVFGTQTAATIASDALTRSGIYVPTAAQKDRAQNIFLRAVLADIWTTQSKSGSARFKSLQAVTTTRLNGGLCNYDVPSDFDEEITLTLLDYTLQGQASAGSTTSITIATGLTVEDVEGNYIFIYSGTGVGQTRQCWAYNATSGVATCRPFTTAPDVTSYYTISNAATKLTEETIDDTGGIGETFVAAPPTTYTKLNENGSEYFVLNKPPDKNVYGLMVRYYANPVKLDETGDILSAIYNSWYHVLLVGTAWMIAENESSEVSERMKSLFVEYKQLKKDLIAKEIPFGTEFTGFEL